LSGATIFMAYLMMFAGVVTLLLLLVDASVDSEVCVGECKSMKTLSMLQVATRRPVVSEADLPDDGESRTVPSSPKSQPTQSMISSLKTNNPARAIAARVAGLEAPSMPNHKRNTVVSMVSASYGGRGQQTEMPQCPQGMSCVMYTDTPVQAANGWMVDLTPYHTKMQKSHPDLFTSGRNSYGRISNQIVNNTMAAKFYKMNMFLLPHAAGVDIVFWCDADSIKWVCGIPQLADHIRNALRGRELAVKSHEERNYVRLEMAPAVERIGWLNSAKQDMDDAWTHMEKMGFKDDAGLFHCNHFIFDAHSPVVQNLLHAWWHEVQNYTFRDQISFPFVLQRFKPNMRVIKSPQENFFDMPRLEITD